MWSDNETSHDLLGFKVHSDLIRDVVTDPDLLPVVLGVFGDWGGGKSSIMKMLQADLETEAYRDVACLYFNGWMFEGFADAKTALLTSILLELGEHKHFGPKVRDNVVGLLQRVHWMEVGKLAVKHVGIPLAAAAMTGGAGGAQAFFASFLHPHHEDAHASGKEVTKGDKKDDKDKNWLDKVIETPSKPDLLEVRKFRDDFERMLAETGIRSLVVLIDDLDRCLPDRIIETLEAIKLFVAVPKTAFVIGADPRIVRHAISTRYASRQLGADASDEEEYDLVKDYLEKLIQIPYHLPRLSPAEMETYISLLLCQKYLDVEGRTAVMTSLGTKRQQNCYTAFSYGDVREALAGRPLPPELEIQLAWSSAVALSITEGLKGNPRQVKRMLNAMLLRAKLASIAGLTIKPDVLAKLMVLEYVIPARFKDVDNWQTVGKGFPQQLNDLEQAARSNRDTQPAADDGFAEWRKPRAQDWLRMDPPLGEVDLRDYFWIARDRTKSTLSAASMVSPLVRQIFSQLISDNRGEQLLAVSAVRDFDPTETEQILLLLEQQVKRHPDQDEAIEALRLLIEQGTEGAAVILFTSLRSTSAETMTPSAATKVALIAKTKPALKADAVSVLELLQGKAKTQVGKAAEIELKGLG